MVQLASIGTQFTEAFAGLDRIREILQMLDRGRRGPRPRADAGSSTATSTFDDVSFEYNAGVTVLDDVSFHAEAGRRRRSSVRAARARAR